MAAFDVQAAIPGTVSVLNVHDGASVHDGEVLLEIECMKTLWALPAPAAGVVRFHVHVGEMVGQGQVVATVETD